MKKEQTNSNIIWIIIGLFILIGFGYVLFSKQNKSENSELEISTVTLTATTICLPYPDTEAPHTDECALGFKTNDGNNYALSGSNILSSNEARIIENQGNEVKVIGVVTKKEDLEKDNQYLKYDIVGVISVASIEKTGNGVSTNTQIVRGGLLSFVKPNDFGLAITKDQILVKSYIPPCEDGFDYCLYYKGDTYKGTNLEGAGLSIKNRTDLTTQESCLNTSPTSYADLKSTVENQKDYSISTFDSVGDAGAGHYASGAIKRLSFDSSCFEFETRIGQSQFGNYPEGAIEKFTDEDNKVMQNKLNDILKSVRFTSDPAESIFS